MFVQHRNYFIETRTPIFFSSARSAVFDESLKGLLPLLHLGVGETALNPAGSRQTGGRR